MKIIFIIIIINRERRDKRGSSGRGRRGSKKRGSKMEIILTQSMEDEEEEEGEGGTDYLSGALGLIPTDQSTSIHSWLGAGIFTRLKTGYMDIM